MLFFLLSPFVTFAARSIATYATQWFERFADDALAGGHRSGSEAA